MPQITRLVAGKRNPGRANVYVDGRFTFAISLDTVLRDHLKVGIELRTEAISAYQSGDAREHLYGKILNFLSYRPRSVKEVRDRVRRFSPDLPNEELGELLARLEREGYLSDLAFARWFVDSRVSHRPRSRLHLSSELFAKGISKAIIQSVLPENNQAALQDLITRHANYSRERLVGYLARKGFSYSDIQAALEESAL